MFLGHLFSEIFKIFKNYFYLFMYILAASHSIQDGSPTRDHTWASSVKAPNPNH